MRVLVGCVALGLLAGCGGGGEAPRLSDAAALGERMFHDTSLSASGRQACASCHVPAFGHAQNNVFPAQFGGPDLTVQGQRVAPSIRYLGFAPAFGFDTEGRPRGGLFWDGRASSLAEQAAHPLLSPHEMALRDKADLAAKLAAAAYADDFRRVFGADILDRPEQAFARATEALARFQQEAPELQPFSSKYDAVLRGQVTLQADEARGLALFEDPARGNCAVCHPSRPGANGRPPLFTDFGYRSLGLPRNEEIAANADPAHVDLGLCARPELAARQDLCGMFKVPSLRNVALRRALFHNGRFRDLREALSFYARRDSQPELFYPRRPDGSPDRFDDLPETLRINVEQREAPYGRRSGDPPAFSDAEIDDLIAFLRTLTDGWSR